MIHVTPIADLHEHIEDTTCPCEPKVCCEGPEIIVVHNAFDGREGLEWAEEILSNISPTATQ